MPRAKPRQSVSTAPPERLDDVVVEAQPTLEERLSVLNREPPMLDGISLLPGGGEALDVLGNRWTIKVSAEESGGAIAVLEASFRPSSGCASACALPA